jgi:hypothetical protein
MQAMIAHGLLSGTLCYLANHHHPSFSIGAPGLVHSLFPACPHSLDRISANSPGIKSCIIKMLPRTEKEYAIIKKDSNCKDEAERELT